MHHNRLWSKQTETDKVSARDIVERQQHVNTTKTTATPSEAITAHNNSTKRNTTEADRQHHNVNITRREQLDQKQLRHTSKAKPSKHLRRKTGTERKRHTEEKKCMRIDYGQPSSTCNQNVESGNHLRTALKPQSEFEEHKCIRINYGKQPVA